MIKTGQLLTFDSLTRSLDKGEIAELNQIGNYEGCDELGSSEGNHEAVLESQGTIEQVEAGQEGQEAQPSFERP
jgi:hypothetical protein